MMMRTAPASRRPWHRPRDPRGYTERGGKLFFNRSRRVKPAWQRRVDKRITLADTSLWNWAFEWKVPTSSDEVMELLEELPSGFTKDYDYGLGLAKNYRFIIEAVEELSDCTEIVISTAKSS